MSFSCKSLFARFRPLLWALSIVIGFALVYHVEAAPPRPVSSHAVRIVKAQSHGKAAKHSAGLSHTAPARRPGPRASGSLPFILHSFDGTIQGGSQPDGGPLVYVPTLGQIYGTTTGGGAFSQVLTGTVFSLDPTANGTVTTLATVAGVGLNNGLAMGYDPNSQMILYGTDTNSTTSEIFSVNPANDMEASVRDFNDGTSPYPAYPLGGLVAAPDGYLYGTTHESDTSHTASPHNGVLYRFLPSAVNATFQILHRFADDGSEGHPMKGALPLVSSSGVIYGVSTDTNYEYSEFGPTNITPGTGYFYKYDPSISDPTQRFQIVTRLDPGIVGNLTETQSGLVQGSDGMLYGTTDAGGAKGNGTVYRINPADNSVTLQYTFDQTQAAGGVPIAGLTVGADHNLYGTTTARIDSGSSTVNPGSVFRLRPDGSGNYDQIDVLHQFAAYDTNDEAPEGICLDAMIEVNGILFGTCNSGGQSDEGLIFQVDDSLPAAPAPTITTLTYSVHDDGTSEVDVTGANFVSVPTADITNTNEAGLTVTFGGATSLTLNLPRTILAGDHTVTITNPDGQSVKATMTTLDAPAILTPSTAVTDTNGAVHLIVSGFNFAPPGYNGAASGSIVVVQAVDAQGNVSDVDTTIASGPDAPAGTTGPQQFIVTLNSTDAGSFIAYDHFNVEVFNADGQHTPLPDLVPHVAHGTHPRADSQTAANFLVFDQSQTQYHFQLTLPPNLLGDCNGVLASENAQIAAFNAQASPTQLLLGNLSLLQEYGSVNVSAQGTGSTVTGVISNDGGSIISHDSGGLIGQDGNGVISNDGGSLIGQDGNGLIGKDGSNLIGQDGNGLIGQDGNGLIGQDGNGIVVHASALIGDIQASASLNGDLHVTGIVSQGGGNARSQAKRKPHDASTPALSFDMTRHDEGPTHGTEPTEATFVAEFTNGTSELVLDIRYTPGQPDIIEYIAPGVTLTPTNGTPAPTVNTPVPTLTSLSPNAAVAGSGDTTITATGTLFTSGSVVDFNGQALTTTVISGTTLTAVVPAALLATPGTSSVTVVNPAPSGGTSNALAFTLSPATPPTTTATVAGAQNSSGAYTSTATVTLTAAAGSFPVAATTYNVDGGASQTYTSPFTVGGNGPHTVTYSSTDTLGNAETAKSLSFAIDSTTPVTTATVTGPQNAAGAYTKAATVTLTAAAGSFPIAATSYSVDGGASQTYTSPFTISAAGGHTVAYFSTDTAGNAETAKTLTLTVQPIAHTFPAGLQMFAVPGDFSGVPLGSALTPAPSRLLIWDPGTLQYDDASALAPGQGCWARFAQDTALYDLGKPTDTSKPFGIALQKGWNMIGDPFPSPVSLTTAQVQDLSGKSYTFSDASKAGLVAYTLYSYPAGSSRYQVLDGSGTLSPYLGYWLYAAQDCTLEVSAS
jgi:uncharacterized repeat protein (TIGR03803 family)